MRAPITLTALFLFVPTVARADMAAPFPFTNGFTRASAAVFVLAVGAGFLWWRRRARRGKPGPPPAG